MACCLTAPSHYLNQFWLLSRIYWHSSEGNFTSDILAIDRCNWFENYFFKILNLPGTNELKFIVLSLILALDANLAIFVTGDE